MPGRLLGAGFSGRENSACCRMLWCRVARVGTARAPSGVLEFLDRPLEATNDLNLMGKLVWGLASVTLGGVLWLCGVSKDSEARQLESATRVHTLAGATASFELPSDAWRC